MNDLNNLADSLRAKLVLAMRRLRAVEAVERVVADLRAAGVSVRVQVGESAIGIDVLLDHVPDDDMPYCADGVLVRSPVPEPAGEIPPDLPPVAPAEVLPPPRLLRNRSQPCRLSRLLPPRRPRSFPVSSRRSGLRNWMPP